MKFQVTMKDPDSLGDAVKEAAEEQLATIEGIDADEKESLIEGRAAKLSDFACKWMEYGEYITVEFDTDAGTATVVPGKQ